MLCGYYMLRAYKLGKGRWSYNKCSLTLRQVTPGAKDTARQLTVSKAVVDEEWGSLHDDQVGTLVVTGMRPPNALVLK